MSGVIAGRVTVPHGAVIVTRSVIGAHWWCGDTRESHGERYLAGLGEIRRHNIKRCRNI